MSRKGTATEHGYMRVPEPDPGTVRIQITLFCRGEVYNNRLDIPEAELLKHDEHTLKDKIKRLGNEIYDSLVCAMNNNKILARVAISETRKRCCRFTDECQRLYSGPSTSAYCNDEESAKENCSIYRENCCNCCGQAKP